ncbi:MAG: VRR-NUC domain-containing protein [Turicibacter sanguinis]
MREKSFENKVKKFLKEQGCYFIKYWGGGIFTQEGVPDLLVCCNGHFLGIELKSPTGTPSELQKYNIQEIRKAGGKGIILYPSEFETFKSMIIKLNQKIN